MHIIKLQILYSQTVHVRMCVRVHTRVCVCVTVCDVVNSTQDVHNTVCYTDGCCTVCTAIQQNSHDHIRYMYMYAIILYASHCM